MLVADFLSINFAVAPNTIDDLLGELKKVQERRATNLRKEQGEITTTKEEVYSAPIALPHVVQVGLFI
jgi:hypothetical protein